MNFSRSTYGSLAAKGTQEIGSIKFVAILFCKQSAKITTFLLLRNREEIII